MSRRIARWAAKSLWVVVPAAVLVAVGFAAQYLTDEAAETPGIRPTEQRAAQPVRVVVAAEEPIQAWLFAEGTARAVEREFLTFDMSGRVTMVKPEKEGVPVAKGELLAEIDKRRRTADVDSAVAALQEVQTQATAANADINQAQTQFVLAQREFERMEELVQQGAVSQTQFDEAQAKLENARAQVQSAEAHAEAIQASIAAAEARLRQTRVTLEDAEIISPIDGVVAYLNIEEGWHFTPNIVRTGTEAEALQTVPIVVIDPSQYEITVDVPSYQADLVEVGQPAVLMPSGSAELALAQALEAELATGDTPGIAWHARGEVFSVNPAVNPGGRSIQVKIRTTEGAESLRDGMFVSCWIATEQKPNAVVAPFDAFLYEDNEPYVFVLDPQTRTVDRREVALGIRGLQAREILAGVAPGEQLVTEGRYRLVEGAPVDVLDAAPPVETESLNAQEID